jgi:hypothetical protein
MNPLFRPLNLLLTSTYILWQRLGRDRGIIMNPLFRPLNLLLTCTYILWQRFSRFATSAKEKKNR